MLRATTRRRYAVDGTSGCYTFGPAREKRQSWVGSLMKPKLSKVLNILQFWLPEISYFEVCVILSDFTLRPAVTMHRGIDLALAPRLILRISVNITRLEFNGTTEHDLPSIKPRASCGELLDSLTIFPYCILWQLRKAITPPICTYSIQAQDYTVL